MCTWSQGLCYFSCTLQWGENKVFLASCSELAALPGPDLVPRIPLARNVFTYCGFVKLTVVTLWSTWCGIKNLVNTGIIVRIYINFTHLHIVHSYARILTSFQILKVRCFHGFRDFTHYSKSTWVICILVDTMFQSGKYVAYVSRKVYIYKI